MARPVAGRGEARARVLDAALDLFAQNGVNGTSLQMIADHLGVTKAAVYYQFHTKDEIVMALLAPPMEQLEQILDEAARQRTRARRLQIVLEGLVDLQMNNRRAAAVFWGDPALAALLHDHEPLQEMAQRFQEVVLGRRPATADRVAMAVLGPGLMLAGMDPNLADLDERTLRTELLEAGRRLLRLTNSAGAHGYA